MLTSRILVAGANGINGRAFLAQLKSSGVCARALVRDKQRANDLQSELTEVVEANFTDVSSLERAFEDITLAYIIAPIDPGAVLFFKNIFKVAKSVGVRHIVKLSGYGAVYDSKSEILRQHYLADELLSGLGINFTIVQPNSFFQNLLWQKKSLRSKGRFTSSLGDARQSFIDIRDVAEVVFNIFNDNKYINSTYRLTGPESLSCVELALQLSTVLTKEVKCRTINADMVESELLLSGMPIWNAHALAEIQEEFSGGEYADISDDAALLLGRSPRSFTEFVKDYKCEF